MKLTIEIDIADLKACDLGIIEFLYKHQKNQLRAASVKPAPTLPEPNKMKTLVANMRAA